MLSEEQILIELDLTTDGCYCHRGSPPCKFCENLTEEQVDIFERHGWDIKKALKSARIIREEMESKTEIPEWLI